MKEEAREIRSSIEPVFSVNLELDLVDMPPVREETVEPYLPPPTGTNTIVDFRILAHMNLKVFKSKKVLKGGVEGDSEYDEVSEYRIQQPGNLAPVWLHISPSAENHYMEIIYALNEGLEVMQCFERWSKHPDMKLYIDVLEEWDDKISDELLINDVYLHPDDWIDGIRNEQKRELIK